MLLQYLVKSGALTQLEAGAIATIEDLVVFIKGLKAYAIYPTGKNGQTEQKTYAQGQSNSNINRSSD